MRRRRHTALGPYSTQRQTPLDRSIFSLPRNRPEVRQLPHPKAPRPSPRRHEKPSETLSLPPRRALGQRAPGPHRHPRSSCRKLHPDLGVPDWRGAKDPVPPDLLEAQRGKDPSLSLRRFLASESASTSSWSPAEPRPPRRSRPIPAAWNESAGSPLHDLSRMPYR